MSPFQRLLSISLCCWCAHFLSTAAQDYVPILGRQLEISPGVALLSVVLDLLDDTEVEALEQFTVTVEPAEGEEQGVMIQQPDTEVFIVSDDGKNPWVTYFVTHGFRGFLMHVSHVCPMCVAFSLLYYSFSI